MAKRKHASFAAVCSVTFNACNDVMSHYHALKPRGLALNFS
jgi:hypothetical protein